jgi:Aspartate-semialdehyde dehydrogenase
MALKPLRDAAGLARVRVSTYQSVSGAGAQRMEELRTTPPGEADIAMDWNFDGDESDEESKLRSETRKILELPELPVSATCVRVPVMVGHAEAVWVETEEAAFGGERARAARTGPGVRLQELPTTQGRR